jgi:2-amino-4-hydroxy-6-hydroxymethyldihydropteridine diphosphokinase
MSALVYIGLGSNVDRERNITLAIREMRKVFGVLEISPVYESAAVGFDGSDFLNLVAGFKTEIEVDEVVETLRKIEDSLGRDRSQPRFSPRPIDLDILTYDDLKLDEPGIQIPRHEILQNAFVLRPLQDIAPNEVHPVETKTYAQLWQEMEPHAGRIEVYQLNLN